MAWKTLRADAKTYQQVEDIREKAARKYGKALSKKEIIRVAVQNLLAQPKVWDVWK
jgi:hypothetical protein